MINVFRKIDLERSINRLQASIPLDPLSPTGYADGPLLLLGAICDICKAICDICKSHATEHPYVILHSARRLGLIRPYCYVPYFSWD